MRCYDNSKLLLGIDERSYRAIYCRPHSMSFELKLIKKGKKNFTKKYNRCTPSDKNFLSRF